MGYYVVKGGNEISGTCHIRGSKNATLPILVATLLTEDEVILENCPEIEDVTHTLEILRQLGCDVTIEERTVTISAKNLKDVEVPVDLACKMRSSILFFGALLARAGIAKIPRPGGCVIGERPINLHVNAFKQMGVVISEEDCALYGQVKHILGYHIYLDYPSVGATENILLLSVLAKGTTVIYNAAKEPEIVSLVRFLKQCGAEIYGEGTETIMIEGVKKLHGTCFQLPFDRIQAGSFLTASALTGGNIFLEGVAHEGMDAICRILEDVGCQFRWSPSGLFMQAPKVLYSNVKITTGPYPQFPNKSVKLKATSKNL
ncbi:MAG: UDP-N-acetylglucosamine 1-carboxyvinyltransferase [Bacillota bacterium]